MSTDIALTWNSDLAAADFSLAGGDLEQDEGLTTAVIVSLFTDRLAAADDVLPDGTDDRRGWWADSPIGGGAATDFIGSRLWLLDRSKQTTATAVAARGYVQEALQWMLDDGVAQQVDVTVTYPALSRMDIAVAITRQVRGRTVQHRYDIAWGNTVGMAVS